MPEQKIRSGADAARTLASVLPHLLEVHLRAFDVRSKQCTDRRALLLVSHGSVDELGTSYPRFLPTFAAVGRRCPTRNWSPKVRRRYQAIGGHSPLNAICRDVATGLTARLGVPSPARGPAPFFRPSPKDVLAEPSFPEGIRPRRGGAARPAFRVGLRPSRGEGRRGSCCGRVRPHHAFVCEKLGTRVAAYGGLRGCASRHHGCHPAGCLAANDSRPERPLAAARP